jgi:hypothetical protein
MTETGMLLITIGVALATMPLWWPQFFDPPERR